MPHSTEHIEHSKLLGRITICQAIHFGKPCIAGTRITVQDVLELLQENLSSEEIIQDYYPNLHPEDVRACLEYAIYAINREAATHVPTH